MGWSEAKRLPSEGPEPNLGAGISRPLPSEATRLYRLSVKQPGKPVLRLTIPAPTKAKAIKYCQNRWPDCTVEVLQ
jgi:hypothetical protein